jgi:Druantia protein DruA/DDE_Tnp_1-associated
MSKTRLFPDAEQPPLLDEVQVRLANPQELPRVQSLLRRHHYLGCLRAVGERLFYIAVDQRGQWVAVLIFCAAAKYLRHRDRCIGWTHEQRRRRLALVVNNARYLLIPHRTVPNLGSRVLKLSLARLSADWQQKYGHPVLLVESFVDPEQFCGTVYRANGWQELGPTDGWGRCARDYYVKHDKPKRLFVKELCRNACRSLQAEHLKPALAMVEAKVAPRCSQRVPQIRSLTQHFQSVPEYRGRVESYPLWSLLASVACAIVSGAQRGPKALAGFAKKLSQAQRRALGIRPHANGWYPAPSAPTFSRALQAVDPEAVDRAVLDFQAQVRGQPPKEELVALDGKEPKHGGGHSLLSAVSVPSQYYLGSAVVDQKTNEIPVARKLFPKLDLEGRFVSLDALHTQTETGLDVVQEHGAHYTLTVKDNQPAIHDTIKKLLPEIPAAFPP